MSIQLLLTIAVAVAILHPVIMRIMLEIAQPLRLRMADLGSEMLASTTLNAAQKGQVLKMLDSAFEWRFMIAAAFCIPFLSARKLAGASLKSPFDTIAKPETVKQVDKLVGMHIASTAAANPLFALIVAVEFIVMVPLILAVKFVTKQHVTIKAMSQRIALLLESHHAGQMIATGQ